MNIIMISANPLFVEAITETLEDCLDTKVHSAAPDEALAQIDLVHAEVLLVDESIPPGMLKEILRHAQNLTKTRLILLNSTGNDLIILDSVKATIGNVDDLVKSIQMKELSGPQPMQDELDQSRDER